MSSKAKLQAFSLTSLLLSFMLIFNTVQSKNAFMQLLSNERDYSQLSFSSQSLTPTTFDIKNLNNGTTSIFHYPNSQPIIQFDSFEKLTVNAPLKLNTSNIDFLLTYEDSHFSYENIDQWSLVSIDDFQENAAGWSKETMSTCGTNNNLFLGGHCNFGGIDVNKTFTGIPKHTMLRITANFHFFDQWEGEDVYMKFNNNTVWFENYQWCDKVLQWKCKQFGINVCGADYPDRLGVPIDFTVYHNETQFELIFGSTLKKSSCIASWGIDDVAVYIR